MVNLYLLLAFISALHLNTNSVKANPNNHCASTPGVCWAVGDPHVRRFNGQTYLFTTSGKVLVLSDRKSIWVRMALKSTGRATQIMSVYIDFIYQDGSKYGKRTKIVFEKDEDHVKVNYRIRPLPYSKWGIEVKPIRFGTLVDAQGIHIKWLNSARLFITLGTQYVGKVDGECGIYCEKPPGRGYSSSKRNRAHAALDLDKPYDSAYADINSMEFNKLATDVENSIRKLYDPTFIIPKVTGITPGGGPSGRKRRDLTGAAHTIVNTTITVMEEDKPATAVQKEIHDKLLGGHDKEGHTLGDLLHIKIDEIEVGEPEVEMSENDYDIEPEITASDEEDDAEVEIQDAGLQGQGSPYFGQHQNHPVKHKENIVDEADNHAHHDDHDDHDHDHAYNADHHIHHDDHEEHFTHAPDTVEHHEHEEHHEEEHHDVEVSTIAPTDCASKGVEYKTGAVIEESYGTCTCHDGQWECENGFGICGLWGPDNIETFDEKHLKLDNECNYFLVSDCGTAPKFTVSTEEKYACTENIKEKKRTLILSVGKDHIMKIGDGQITLHTMGNTEHIHPPMNITVGSSSGVIMVTENEKKVKIALNNDLMIEWNRKLYYGITLRRPEDKKHVCGLCGNFNGDTTDDIKSNKHISGCRAKHPGCHHKDKDFVYPKQVYNVTCDDIEKVEFPVYHGEGCKKIKDELLNQCMSCVADIPNVCLHPTNLGCIKMKEKTCVTDLFAHFLRTCYTQIFTAQAAAAGNMRRKRDLRVTQLKQAIGSVDVDKMSIEDINKALRK